MRSISSFDIIRVAIPEARNFLCISVSASSADANPYGIKMLLGNGLITFLINGNPVFNNGPICLPRNLSNCTVLNN